MWPPAWWNMCKPFASFKISFVWWSGHLSGVSSPNLWALCVYEISKKLKLNMWPPAWWDTCQPFSSLKSVLFDGDGQDFLCKLLQVQSPNHLALYLNIRYLKLKQNMWPPAWWNTCPPFFFSFLTKTHCTKRSHMEGFNENTSSRVWSQVSFLATLVALHLTPVSESVSDS